MASRKEEKERLRRQREEAEKQESKAERKRLLFGYVVAGLISVAVIIGIVFVIAGGSGSGGGGQTDVAGFGNDGVVPGGAKLDEREGDSLPAVANPDLDSAAEEGKCDLQRDLPSDGSTHFSDEDKEVDYSTNPPASGDHYGVPNENGSGALASGPYSSTPPTPRVVHALEHGRVAIQYKPDLPEAQQLKLKGIFDEQPLGVVLLPNPDLDDNVAVTAWEQLITCESVEDAAAVDAIRDFRDNFLGRGPEDFPLEA